MNTRSERRPVLLIVDDDPQIRELLDLLFTDDGFDVLAVGDADEAVKVFSERVDVVVLDLMMPGTSGVDLLPKLAGVPVLALTALPKNHRLVRDVERAGVDVMVK